MANGVSRVRVPRKMLGKACLADNRQAELLRRVERAARYLESAKDWKIVSERHVAEVTLVGAALRKMRWCDMGAM